ncbi:MAG TPA: hypothetical protein VG096_25075 [Bryobacteraceae bacterium]|jgi:hypothetical protein|nr:hypothetical protein [Bryobacteraceae bacterium]
MKTAFPTLATLALVAAVLTLVPHAAGQGRGRGRATEKAGPFTRLPDGKPNMQGYWETRVFFTAFDLEAHERAEFGVPAGPGVVVDPPNGKIPYQPWALEKKKDIVAHHMFDDPQAHCWLSGVPRQMYTPFGFQILQPPGNLVLLYEAFHSYRIIALDGRPHPPSAIRMFEGDSRGHWEGDTLVVDVTNQNEKTWFDMSGNFHSDALHVIERYTMVDANTIKYEATLEDPKVYTQPMKIAFELGRNLQPNYEQLEYACVEGEQDLQHYTEGEGAKKK